MLKLFTVLALLIFVSNACKQKAQSPLGSSKEGELETHFREKLRIADSTIRLDSFRFISLDTLTMRDKIASQLKDNLQEINDLSAKSEDLLEDMKSDAKIARLSNGLSSTLYETYKEELNDKKKKFDENDAVLSDAFKKGDSLRKVYDHSDSTTPIAYEAKCLYQIRRKDLSVKKDTAYIVLNNEMNIIRSEDFKK